MNPALVPVVLLGLVALSTAVGMLWRASQGRVHHVTAGAVVRASDIPGIRRLARGITLLQFSTEICAPCEVTRSILGTIAGERTGVTHIDLDLTHRPDLAARFHIMQTPTTLILDSRGQIRARIGGAPRVEALTAELDRIVV
ncbi:MAG: thioredoxin family protein, partial [Rhodoglobus sp.]